MAAFGKQERSTLNPSILKALTSSEISRAPEPSSSSSLKHSTMSLSCEGVRGPEIWLAALLRLQDPICIRTPALVSFKTSWTQSSNCPELSLYSLWGVLISLLERWKRTATCRKPHGMLLQPSHHLRTADNPFQFRLAYHFSLNTGKQS